MLKGVIAIFTANDTLVEAPQGQAFPAKAQGSLRSAGTALDVLGCFAVDSELGVSDVARRLGIAKSTAHRLLQTLCSRNFIEQDPQTGLYRLGLHLYELGHLAQARNTMRHAALPHMQHIARLSGHSVNLGVPDGADVVFIERIEPLLEEGIIGRRQSMHCTSSGKVIAAFNPSADHARRQAGFPAQAPGTVRTSGDWDQTLERVRRSGFAVSRNESFDNITSIAVPVLRRRRAVGALSVFDKTEAITPHLDRLHVLLATAAHRISTQIDGGRSRMGRLTPHPARTH